MSEVSGGEPDIALLASAFADPRRVRVLMALADGRTLPAGRLAEEAGVAASTVSNHLAVLLERGLVHHLDSPVDRLSAPGNGTSYRLTGDGAGSLAAWGITREVLSVTRPLRYCVDWTEQAHHLAGPLGTAVGTQLFELGWVVRGPVLRSVRLTREGEAGLAQLIAWPASAATG
jgi:hypothetical protein